MVRSAAANEQWCVPECAAFEEVVVGINSAVCGFYGDFTRDACGFLYRIVFI